MKKLLLAGLLVVSSMALAAVESVGGDATGVPEAKVPVKARVIAPLKVTKAKDVDFGVIMQGQQNKVQEVVGVVTVEGQQGETIRVFAKDSSGEEGFREWKSSTANNPYEVKLTEAGSKQTMTSKLKLDYKNTLEAKTQDITISGTASAAEGQAVGNYSGELAVRVMYQ